ncbi:MAG: DUF1385 domain-containing protein [Eubacteriales bacterium]
MKDTKRKLPSIGGQAVMEGVMMRNGEATSIAIRKSEKVYNLKNYKTSSKAKGKPWYKKWVFVRGVTNFVDIMKLGITSLNDSVQMLGIEEEEPSKFEKWLAEKTGKDIMDIAMSIAIFLGIGFAVVLFIILPNLLTSWISKSITNSLAVNLIEGLVRILIFIGYIVAISQMKDIKRFFGFHGAEHKTINAFEAGKKLTVENVQSYTTKHPRCGTSFLVFIMLVSVIVFSLTGWEGQLWWERIIMRIVLLPVVASISYEILMGLANKNNLLVRILRWPGMQVQKLTTNEPDDGMVAAAIISALSVLDDDLFDEYAPEEFKHVSPRYQEEETEPAETFADAETDENAEEVTPAPKKEYTIIDFDKELEKQKAAEAAKKAQEAEDTNEAEPTDK